MDFILFFFSTYTFLIIMHNTYRIPLRYFLFIALAVSSANSFAQTNETEEIRTLPTVDVSADALDPDDPRPKKLTTATKTALDIKDIPQTITFIDVSKYKAYGVNDLSVMLDGYAGIDTSYDMRGEGIMIRGFDASYGDIYRDGVRSGGQIRRNTANIERIEVLKGPASVLYGRGSGGGVINMISKVANFESPSSINVRVGRWHNYGTTVDVNKILNQNWAIRLTADKEQADSFRRNIQNRNTMYSPSIAYDGHNGLRWTAQYTYDNVWRRPDRAPSYKSLPLGVSNKIAYAHPDDFVEDKSNTWRSVLSYDFTPDWSLKWTIAYIKADQNFDHLFAGRYNQKTRLVTFNRAWQETSNRTLSNNLDMTGKFSTGNITHEVLLGAEFSTEKRLPKLGTAGATSKLQAAYPYGVDPYNPQWIHPKSYRGAPTQHNKHKAKTGAFYIQDLVSFTSQWKILAGLRFEKYKFSSRNLLNNQSRSYSDSSLSPRVGIIWEPVPQHSLYASFSKSFAPYGGRGMITLATASNAVFDDEPQYSRQYEGGIKSDWLDGKLSSQISVFQIEKYNIRYRPDPVNDPYHWEVQGKQRSRGIDFSLNGQIFDKWYIRSSLGYQQATVVQDKSTPANEGKYLSGVSKRTGSIYIRYVPTEKWYAEVGAVSRSSVYTNSANTDKRAGYTVWNASVGWRPAPWMVTFSLSNITNKGYWRSNAMPGTPRSFLLSASYMF